MKEEDINILVSMKHTVLFKKPQRCAMLYLAARRAEKKKNRPLLNFIPESTSLPFHAPYSSLALLWPCSFSFLPVLRLV